MSGARVTERAAERAKVRTVQLTLRVRADVADYYREVAELRGLTVNELLAGVLEVVAEEEQAARVCAPVPTPERAP